MFQLEHFFPATASPEQAVSSLLLFSASTVSAVWIKRSRIQDDPGQQSLSISKAERIALVSGFLYSCVQRQRKWESKWDFLWRVGAVGISGLAPSEDHEVTESVALFAKSW